MGDFGVSTSNRFASLYHESARRSSARPKPVGDNSPAYKAAAVAVQPNASKASALKNAAPAAARQSNKPAGPAGRARHGEQRGAGADKPKGKRVFDKYSHSGKGQVPKEGKKAGGGRFNWGGKEEKQLEALAETSAADQAAVADDNAATTPSADATADAPSVEEAEPAQRTYAEFKAAEEAKHAALKPKVHLRQAGEGEDAAAWASFKPFEKADDAVSFGAAPVKSAKKTAKAAKAGSSKEVAISADKLFKIRSEDDSQAPRGGPRDARRGRGPKPESSNARPARQQQARGANRAPNKSRAQNIALNDTKAFPSLK